MNTSRFNWRVYRDFQGRRNRKSGVANTVYALGTLLVEQGRFAQAEPILRKCLAFRQHVLPPGHWRVPNTMSRLGASLIGLGRFAEAEPLLLDGFNGLSNNHHIREYYKRRSLERIVDLYQKWHAAEPNKGYDAKAAESHVKVIELEKSSN